MSKNKYLQGYYTPKNPSKYKGKIPFKYRSSYELGIFKIFDESKYVLEWSVESVIVPYFDTIRNKTRKYIVDVYAKFSNQQQYLFEIKPLNKLLESKQKTIPQKKEHINIMDKAKTVKNYCKILNQQGKSNIQFAFICLVQGKFQIIKF